MSNGRRQAGNYGAALITVCEIEAYVFICRGTIMCGMEFAHVRACRRDGVAICPQLFLEEAVCAA